MNPITVAFFGISGSGKGTQAQLLIDALKKNDPSRATVRAEIAYRLQFFSGSETAERLSIVAAEDENVQVRRWAEHSLRGFLVHGSGSEPQPIPPAGPEPSHRYP